MSGNVGRNGDSIERHCDEGVRINGFCFLGNKVNASGGNEAAVTLRVKTSGMKFRECEELLLENGFR